jgi:hypothetical protein
MRMNEDILQWLKEDWSMPNRKTCARCLADMMPLARVERGKWCTYLICDCGSVNWIPVEWPFTRPEAYGEDLEKLGFAVIVPGHTLEDNLKREEELHNDEVAHGWEKSYHAHGT